MSSSVCELGTMPLQLKTWRQDFSTGFQRRASFGRVGPHREQGYIASQRAFDSSEVFGLPQLGSSGIFLKSIVLGTRTPGGFGGLDTNFAFAFTQAGQSVSSRISNPVSGAESLQRLTPETMYSWHCVSTAVLWPHL